MLFASACRPLSMRTKSFGREKTERRMLPGDQEFILADSATQIAAPAADQPPLEEQLAPADHLSFEFAHQPLTL